MSILSCFDILHFVQRKGIPTSLYNASSYINICTGLRNFLIPWNAKCVLWYMVDEYKMSRPKQKGGPRSIFLLLEPKSKIWLIKHLIPSLRLKNCRRRWILKFIFVGSWLKFAQNVIVCIFMILDCDNIDYFFSKQLYFVNLSLPYYKTSWSINKRSW